MSIPVELYDLPARLVDYPWGYLITSADARPHVLAVVPRVHGHTLRVDAGRSSRANVAVRTAVVVVFPPADTGGYSLLVDGVGVVDGEEIVITPSSAVLHRPAR